MATPSPTPAPAKIFISYKRNIEPDQALATRVFEALHQQGHEVFIDRTLTVGQQWAKEIETRVRASDCLIVFLTAASSASAMVKGEVEMALDQAAKNAGTPRILPVRLAYAGPLPYPLNAWLDPLQYALWQGDADTPQLIQELAIAATGTPLPRPALTLGPASQRDGPPLYSAPLPPPGGALDTGTYAEAWLRSMVRSMLGLRFRISTGAVIRATGKTGDVPQCDLIVWDPFRNAGRLRILGFRSSSDLRHPRNH
jgi:hypothetical protein